MKPAPLLIAIAVLAVLGGLVYYTKENPPPTEEERPKIVSVEAKEIQQATITRPGKDPITVQRGDDDKWKFGPSLTIPASDSSVGLMIESAAAINADRVVEENVTDWSAYGLEGDGSLAVDLKLKDGTSQRVVFGNETPTGSGVFARLEGDPRLFTVFSYAKSSFEKEVFDLREKKLLRVDGGKISRVTLTRDGQSIEFGKSGEDAWQILKPKPARADSFAVGNLVRSVENAEMTAVVAEGKAPPFDKPEGTVEAVDESGTHTLTVVKGEADKYFAKSSDLDGIYEVGSALAGDLKKSLDDFRNKKLFDFGFNEVSRLEVRDGDTRLAIEKKENDWVLASDGGKKLDSEKVQSLIDSLRNLSATSFASDEAGDQAKYGLGTPGIEAQVTPAGSDGTEKVVISSPEKEKVYAARASQPTTYELDKSAVEEVRKAMQELLKEEKPADEGETKKED